MGTDRNLAVSAGALNMRQHNADKVQSGLRAFPLVQPGFQQHFEELMGMADGDKHQAEDELRKELAAAEAEIAGAKDRLEAVQAELQLAWMSIASVDEESAVKSLEQLSGSYELLRHGFLEEEEQLRYEIQECSLGGVEAERVSRIASHVRSWCVSTKQRADEQLGQIRKLSAGFLKLASRPCSLQQRKVEQQRHPQQQEQEEGVSSTDMSRRIQELVQELKSESLMETSRDSRQQREGAGEAETEQAFLKKKKAFLSGLHGWFSRVRQREEACMSLDKRLQSSRLLLEQAKRGCHSSDYISMRSKRQIEQAYKELVHVQSDMNRMKVLSLGEGMPPPQDEQQQCSSNRSSSTMDKAVECRLMSSCDREELKRTKGELDKQVDLNLQLKQQVAKFCVQAERAEGLLAVEKAEVDKLRDQLQGMSERLKHEAKKLGETMRARQATVEKLRVQVRELEERDAGLQQRNEELVEEREELASRVCHLLKLRRDNMSLVVEKIAIEGSARSLHEKMESLMSKLKQTKQQWRRFLVYCEAF